MATTKVLTARADNVENLAGATYTSTSVDLVDGYGASADVKITNNATGPTIIATAQLEVSGDDTEWYLFGGEMNGNVDNNGVESWGGIVIPPGVQYIRLIVTGNTVQSVFIDFDVSEVTAINV